METRFRTADEERHANALIAELYEGPDTYKGDMKSVWFDARDYFNRDAGRQSKTDADIYNNVYLDATKDHDDRQAALSFANRVEESPGKVIERATAYLDFITGTSPIPVTYAEDGSSVEIDGVTYLRLRPAEETL